MPTFETSNLVAILAAARNPEWVEQTILGVANYLGAPSTATHGVPLGDVLQAMYFVGLRREAHRRTAYVTIGTFDAATTYTVTLNGTVVASTGANLAALIAAIIVNVNGSAQAAVLTASQESTSVVKIVGDVEVNFSIAISVAAGTGTITATADASTATARFWVMGASPNAPGRLAAVPSSGDAGAWAAADVPTSSVNYRNLCYRAPVAGMERLYVELFSVLGAAGDGATVVLTPHVWIGPCVVEE